jgi:chemotaxis protein histidine kinase CheA
MNRSLLLVICDFLLLSMLALAKFDEPEEAQQEEVTQAVQHDTLADQDLIEVLRMSLESERDDRVELASDLEETKKELDEREKVLAQKEASLNKTQESLSETQKRAKELEAQRAKLTQEAKRLEEERKLFAQQFDEAQDRLKQAEADRVELAKNLGSLKEDSAASKEKLRHLQQQVKEREEALAAAQSEKEKLAAQAAQAEAARQQLSTRLEVAEAQSQVLQESLQTARADVAVTRQEKEVVMQHADKLAEGVTVLAQSTDRIAQSTDRVAEEVKKSNPLSLNTIYQEYLKNRVTVRFMTEENALIGTSKNTYAVETSLIVEGGTAFAVLHLDDTPFKLSNAGRGLISVDGRIELGGKLYSFKRLFFLAADPRLAAVPLPLAKAEEQGVQTFTLATEPLRFPEAVLIDSGNGGYGEVPFKLDQKDTRYLSMQTDLFNRIFGDFSPGTGDAVFSKTGDWIGLMVNADTAPALQSLAVNSSLDLGENFKPADATRILSARAAALKQLPSSVR